MTTEGWGASVLMSKYHYFRNGMSLCRKWGFFDGPLDQDDLGIQTSDDCKKCSEMRAKERGCPR